ncbi:MAG TPA: metallophosphoesterase [Nitrospiraceae bacterium]|nr:metallophosphoesterase [Nitrospiraceae bacterium]
MILFFVIFFTIYGGVHAYVFFRARTVLEFGPSFGTALVVFMLTMTLAPYVVRLLEQYGHEPAARIVSYIGYFWMGLVFLFFASSLLFDFISLLGRLVGLVTRADASAFFIPPQLSFLISVVLAIAISTYGYFDAKNIRTELLVVETSKLPGSMKKLTIVQISDVHLGLIVGRDRMRKILQKVKAARPDVLVCTGDLVDAQINHLPGLANLLGRIKPRYGKYAVTGNHEYYAGLRKSLRFMRKSGFIVLRGRAVASGGITIVGVDDPTGIQLRIDKPVSEKRILSRLPRNKFTLLLKHRPQTDLVSSRLFDLQLSGHTHSGQIFPFGLLSKIAYRMHSGGYVLPTGSLVYVSRGSGTWGPPIRFLSPPEVTVIEVVRKKRKRR